MSRNYWRILTIMYCMAVAVGSLTPVYGIKSESEFNDIVHNFFHVPAYSVMTLLFIRSLAFQKVSKKYFYAFALAFIWGAFIEVLQGYVPGRDTSIWDLGLNTCGITAAFIWVRRKNRPSKKNY